MSKNAAQVIVEVLESAGVRHIYGVVGDTLNHVTDAMRSGGNSASTIWSAHWFSDITCAGRAGMGAAVASPGGSARPPNNPTAPTARPAPIRMRPSARIG